MSGKLETENEKEFGNPYMLLRDRSILAVRIAKFGPLREPIRILLFISDQFGYVRN